MIPRRIDVRRLQQIPRRIEDDSQQGVRIRRGVGHELGGVGKDVEHEGGVAGIDAHALQRLGEIGRGVGEAAGGELGEDAAEADLAEQEGVAAVGVRLERGGGHAQHGVVVAQLQAGFDGAELGREALGLGRHQASLDEVFARRGEVARGGGDGVHEAAVVEHEGAVLAGEGVVFRGVGLLGAGEAPVLRVVDGGGHGEGGHVFDDAVRVGAVVGPGDGDRAEGVEQRAEGHPQVLTLAQRGVACQGENHLAEGEVRLLVERCEVGDIPQALRYERETLPRRHHRRATRFVHISDRDVQDQVHGVSDLEPLQRSNFVEEAVVLDSGRFLQMEGDELVLVVEDALGFFIELTADAQDCRVHPEPLQWL